MLFWLVSMVSSRGTGIPNHSESWAGDMYQVSFESDILLWLEFRPTMKLQRSTI